MRDYGVPPHFAIYSLGKCILFPLAVKGLNKYIEIIFERGLEFIILKIRVTGHRKKIVEEN